MLPTRCMLCRTWGLQALCDACHSRHAPGVRVRPRCCTCGLAVPLGVKACADCQRLMPPQTATVVAVDYAPPWDERLQRLKFGGQPEWAAGLALALAGAVTQACTAAAKNHGTEGGAGGGSGGGSEAGGGAGGAVHEGLNIDLVLPVPLSAARLGRRGYNQAWEVARRVARILHLPSHPLVLQRWVDLPGQASQDRAARLERLRGVFGVAPEHRHRVAGRRVAVVDDVYTTGATAAEAVRALQVAGAQEVAIWAVARTPLPQDGAS